MKDMGQARKCLGFCKSRNRSEHKLTMSQLSVLSRFGMSDANGARKPMEVSIDVYERSELVTNVPYREAIGSLMYLMVGTRPYISLYLAWPSMFNRRIFCIGKQSSTSCAMSNILRIMVWNSEDLEMLTSSVFAIQTGVVTR
jgi:hypothetical protein